MNEHIERMEKEFFEKCGNCDLQYVSEALLVSETLRKLLVSTYNAGLERAKEVAKREESCGELEELGTCGRYHANESHVIAAIEKEKITKES